MSTAKGSTADLRLLGGQIRVSVADAPQLRARASGEADGATVSWNAPVVTDSVAGQEQTLPADGSPLDIDGDGLKDGAEVRRYGTNPCDRDTDHGGNSDGREVRAGSDPLDIHSRPGAP